MQEQIEERIRKAQEELAKAQEELKQYKENKKLKMYDVVNYKGYDWYVIDIKDNQATLFMKDILSEEETRELFDERLRDSDNDVRFSLNNNIWWKNSPIRMALNSKFVEKIGYEGLNVMKTTVKLDNQKDKTEDYVRLISKEEAESLPEEIRKSSRYGYWTLSPYYFYYNRARGYTVDRGSLSTINVYYGYGVRPVVSTNLDNIVGN